MMVRHPLAICVLVSTVLLSGCVSNEEYKRAQRRAERAENRAAGLERENEGIVSKANEYVNSLTQVLEQLHEISEETDLLAEGVRSGEFPQSQEFDISAKLREQLRVLEEKMADAKELRRKLDVYKGLMREQRQLMESIDTRLRKREQELTVLGKEVKRLEDVTTRQRQTIRSQGDTIDELRLEVRERDSTLRSQDELIQSLDQTRRAFVVVEPKKELKQLARSRQLFKDGGTYFFSSSAISDPEEYASAVRVSVDDRSIQLPNHAGQLVIVSIHKHYPRYYNIVRQGSRQTLELDDPAKFWAVSRYLIVRAK